MSELKTCECGEPTYREQCAMCSSDGGLFKAPAQDLSAAKIMILAEIGKLKRYDEPHNGFGLQEFKEGAFIRLRHLYETIENVFSTLASSANALSAAKKEWRGSLAQIICDIPLPDRSAEYQNGFVTAKEAILDALRKAGFDALSAGDKRYQFLRNSPDGIEFRDGDGKWRADCPSGEELDAIIDAAILKSQKGGSHD